MEYLKRNGEGDFDYIVRLVEGKASGLYDIDYIELFKLAFNVELSSCEARKRFYGIKMLLPYIDREKINNTSYDSILEEFECKRLEFEKERYRFYDQRTAYNKDIRQEARWDELKEIISNSLKIVKPYESKIYSSIQTSNNDLLVGLNDLHLGVEINNYWNKYNSTIAKERLENYIKEIVDIGTVHNSENCYVCANGDLISGNIHYTISIANKENVVEQVMLASELISWFLSELSGHFKNVYFAVVAGNHSRLSIKDNSPKNERLDDLIPFYVKARLQNIQNIEVINNTIDNTMSMVTIRGLNYINVHGDMDKLNNILKLVEMLPIKVYGIMFGHLHHNQSDFIQGYKILMSGSLMGVDDYCIEKRILGKPQQLVCVCTDKGVKAMYDVILE